MMQGTFACILARYGRDVTVYSQWSPRGVGVKAFFQPVREKGTQQSVPSPLGEVMCDRFVYIGPADTRLECADTCRVTVDGEIYRPQMVQPVYVGGTLSHWWAVFTRKEQEVE